MLEKQLVYDVLTAALSTGGDLAEIFMENTTKDTLSMINGRVEKANWGIDYGLGLRIIIGTNAVYAYTNKTDRDSLIRLAKESAEAAKVSMKEDKGITRVITLDKNERQAYKDNITMTPEKKIMVEKLRIASETAYAHDSLITQTMGNFSHINQQVFIANSNGLWATDNRILSRVAFTAVASEGNEKQTGSVSPGAKGGMEFIETLDMKTLATEAATTAVTMLKADLCPSGLMPVIIDNAFGGVIFHEACAHSLEATSVAKGASVFCGKLGEKIAADCVNAVDDGTLEGEWGTLNIDDEGGKPRRNILIENGILKSYLVDYLGGLKMNMPSTGSGRRESYRLAPTSRMTNTYILNGIETPEEIISDTETGLYCKKMGGGSVDPASGEFNFAVNEGYMIRNGKIAEPVRGATLIGKGHEVLLDIDRVANNFDYAQGMCGSISGAVPTNVGQPLIRVKKLTVGGRK